MAGMAARAATGGGGSNNGKTQMDMKGFLAQGGNPFDIGGMKEYSATQNVAGQGGVAGMAQPMGMAEAGMSVSGGPMSDGSTAGIAPAPEVGMPADTSGADQFAGKKFEISPVQMKGSFSSKSRATAEGVYGNEDERNNSLKR